MVPHCSLQHLSWDTTKFVLDSFFQFIQCPWPSRVDPILKVAPQEKNHKRTNQVILWARECHRILRWHGYWTILAQLPLIALQCAMSHILLKPGFVKLWKIVQCTCNKILQHLNIPIRSDSHCDPLFIFEKVSSEDPCDETAHHTVTLLLCKGRSWTS